AVPEFLVDGYDDFVGFPARVVEIARAPFGFARCQHAGGRSEQDGRKQGYGCYSFHKQCIEWIATVSGAPRTFKVTKKFSEKEQQKSGRRYGMRHRSPAMHAGVPSLFPRPRGRAAEAGIGRCRDAGRRRCGTIPRIYAAMVLTLHPEQTMRPCSDPICCD